SGRKDEFLARINGKVSDAWLRPYLDKLLKELKPVATRKASEMALEAINTAIPATVGGSADSRRAGRVDRLQRHQHGHPGDRRRLGRPHRVEQYADERARGADCRPLRRSLHPLRHSR